jgi:DNA modification methylase
MAKKAWKAKVEYRNPTTLIPYVKNSKIHSKEQIDLVAGAIAAFGFTQPIVVDGEGVIIAGHCRREASIALGLQEVPVVVANHLSDEEVIAARIADNKVSEAPWDAEMLKFELNTLSLKDFKLDLTGFSVPDIQAFLNDDISMPDLRVSTPANEGAPDPSPVSTVKDVEPIEEKPLVDVPARVKRGEIWTLGKHRLMCGDSTAITDVERLMAGENADMVFTDPPYGIEYQSNMRTQSAKFDVIENDDTFLTNWINILPLVSNGFIFIWTSWKVLGKWIGITTPLGRMTNMIVWNKGGGGIGDLEGTFSTDHEIALVFNRGAKITGKRIGSVWSIGKDHALEYMHPTQKPVELSEMAIESVTFRDSVVLDLFGGSGSTLIACEHTNRRCFMMEIDPKYCDVIIARWESFTGLQATILSS